MINSQDIKKGTCIRMDGKLYFCIDFLHRKPGKGNTIMNVTLKDVVNGGVIEKRFNIGVSRTYAWSVAPTSISTRTAKTWSS